MIPRWLFSVLWLVACEPPITEDPDTPVGLRFDPAPSASPRARFDAIELFVERVSVEASGPDGPLSVVLLAHSVIDPFSSNASLELRLDRGDYSDMVVGITFGESEGLALVASGSVAEDDDDDDDARPFRLEVERFDLLFELPTLPLATGDPWEGVVALQPLDWLNGLPLEALPDPLVIDPAAGPAYTRLVENVRGAIVLVPPGEVGR